MNTFIPIKWLGFLDTACCYCSACTSRAALFDRWEVYKNKQNASIQIDATRKIVTSMFSPAHWLHGSE